MTGPDLFLLSDNGYCNGKKETLFSACSPRKSFFPYCYFFKLWKVVFAFNISGILLAPKLCIHLH